VIESNLLDISGLILVSYFPQVITWPAKLPPTLVFHSRNDYYCSLACVNEKLKKYDQSKNVEVIGIAGEGHIISMLESKARLFEKVVSFLSQKQ
jgi:dipeptidyl aminopeptidase/acylaminoacyl peptidase